MQGIAAFRQYTWIVLRQIKERRPAMMLSELIDCRTGALQRTERAELRPSAHEPIRRSSDARVESFELPEHLFEKEARFSPAADIGSGRGDRCSSRPLRRHDGYRSCAPNR